MEMPEKPISPLDKVRLSLKAVPHLGNETVESVMSETTLIYGVGSAGIPAFEKMLFEKQAGDQFAVSVESGTQRAIFGHLQGTLRQAVRIMPPYTLHVTVRSVATASNQEVVKAMAEFSKCSGGCDCGCSC